jgi:hypothetical protein
LLIEESRANLALQSEDFATSWSVSNLTVGSDAVVGPSGTQIADSLTATSSTGILFQSVTKAASATTYTVSFYLKSTLNGNVTIALDDGTSTNRGRYLFNLSTGVATGVFNDGTFTNTSGTITAAGNGWYRITCTTTTNTTTTVRIRLFFGPSSSVVYAWGAQLEVGAFATSYIPSVASQVTRAADNASMIGNNFARWYTQGDGTVFTAAQRSSATVSATNTVWQADNNSNDNRNFLQFEATPSLVAGTVAGNVSQSSFSYSTSLGASISFAYGYKVNDFAGVRDGSAASVDSLGILPVVDRFSIGNRLGSNHLNGHIKRIAYFNRRLADSELQGITS